MKHCIILLAMLLGLPILANAQPIYPEITCVEVQLDGSVVVSFTPISGMGIGSSWNYPLYRTTTPPALTFVTEFLTPNSTTSFTDNTINANNQAYSYALITEYSVGGVTVFDTTEIYKTIFLGVNTLGNQNTLTWNAPSTGAYSYEVYRSINNAPFSLLSTTATTTYTDNLTAAQLCNVSYQIRVVGTDCAYRFQSNISTLVDNTPPDSPLLDSVSTALVGNIPYPRIGWRNATGSDATNFRVFRNINNAWVEVTTVNNVTEYVDNATSNNSNSLSYRVAALDACGNISSMTSPQKSILLSINATDCGGKHDLSWNTDIGWNEAVTYEIIQKDITNNTQTIFTSTTSTYQLTNVTTTNSYIYTIRVLGSNRSAISEPDTVEAYSTLQYPVSIMNVSPSTNQDAIIVGYSTCTTNTAAKYELQYLTTDNTWRTYQTYTSLTAGVVNYIPANLSLTTMDTFITLRAAVLDACGNALGASTPHSTIDLRVNNEIGDLTTIDWKYISGYDAISSIQLIKEVKSPTGTITSNIAITNGTNTYIEPSNKDYEVCYTIEIQGTYNGCSMVNASGAIQNVYTRSATLCVAPTVNMYTPNTFTPNEDGINDTFLPVSNYLPSKEYSFQVIDRWGNTIFNTNNPNIGWDGANATDGIYVYKIQYRVDTSNSKSGLKTKTGKIALIR